MNAAEIASLVQNLATLNLEYLGISITILIFMGGAFYLFNFKPLKDALDRQEKTLTDLGREVNENLSSSKKEIKEDLESFKRGQDKTIFDSITQRNEKLMADINTTIVSFEKEFTQKFDSFAEEKDDNLKTIILAEVSDKVRGLEKTLSLAISNSKTEAGKEIVAVKKTLSSLQDNFKEIKRKTGELEVFKYSQKGQMGAIICSIELLAEAIDEDSWRIDGNLEDLYKELEGKELDTKTITGIEEQLVKLNNKPKYAPLLAKIRKLYQA